MVSALNIFLLLSLLDNDVKGRSGFRADDKVMLRVIRYSTLAMNGVLVAFVERGRVMYLHHPPPASQLTKSKSQL